MGTIRHFTLLELLTVIAIIGVLASMLMPAVSRGLDMAMSVRCISNLHQIEQAFTLYARDYHGRFMPYITGGTLYQHPGGNWTRYLKKYYDDTAVLDCPVSPAPAPEDSDEALHLYDGNYGWNYDGTQGNHGPVASWVSKPSRSYLVFDSGDQCIIYGANHWLNLMEELDLDWDSRLEGPNRHRNAVNIAFIDGHAASRTLNEFLAAPCKSYDAPWCIEWQGGTLERGDIPFPNR